MGMLAEKLDAKLREWEPNIAATVRERILEIIDLVDQDALDEGLPVGEPSEKIVKDALPILTGGVMAALGVSPIKLSDIQEAINKVLD